MPIRIVEVEKEGPRKVKTDFRKKRQQEYTKKHGKPDKKRIQIRPKVSDRMQKLRDNLASVTGGEWGKKSGGRLRSKKSVGGIAKIIGRKAVDWIKKNRKTIKKEIYSPEGKKKTQDLTKKLQEGLKKPGHAKGGRIGLQHGNRPRPQGPHTWVKSGGAVLKGKKVGIQIK